MILLTGATGQVGLELAKQLSAQGMAARAMTRSAAATDKINNLAGITPIAGDFDVPASLEAALQGVDRAFLLTNSTERAERQQLAFVEAARRAGVGHIVKLSQLHAATDSPVRFLRYHAAVEQAIRDSGVAYTFLRPNLFMQALIGFGEAIMATGKLFAPIGNARVSLVDARDIAAVALAALTTNGHQGQVYDLTGPQALTHADLARQIGETSGKAVTFAEITPEAMKEAVIKAGFPRWQADGLIEDYAHYARNEAEEISPAVSAITGRPARAFADFLADDETALTTNTGRSA